MNYIGGKELNVLIRKKALAKFSGRQLEGISLDFIQLKTTEKQFGREIKDLSVDIFCPITGEEMTFPSRSVNCKHYECVELDNLLYSVVEYK
jgi:hypothetical protein